LIDPDLALQIIRGENHVIAYDTETSGLNPGRDFICGYVVTNVSDSLYVPVRHEAGGNIPDAAGFEAALADAFRERTRRGFRTVGHNLGFDLRFSGWHGIRLGSPLEDTMINELLIDDRTIGFGLEDCCIRHQVTPKKGDELYRAIAARFGGIPDRKQMANFWRMPGDQHEVVDYATGDGVSTLELWESQQPILDAEQLRVPWQLECDLLPYVAGLHLRGIRIDADYAARIRADIRVSLDEKKSAFSAGFNVRSPKEVEALYRLNGYTDAMFDRTSKGALSFTEKWLETNEIGDAILEVRRLEKADDSFITPLVETKNIRGRVHAQLNQSKSDDFGVAGARFSCSDPNLQAYPKRNKAVGKIVRGLVIADEGMLLEEGDAIQQEPRFFTHYSQDPALVAGYRDDPLFSIHKRADDMMFEGKDYDKAKRMAMGILSMMYPKTLAMHLRVSVAEATALRKKFLYDAFPLIGQLQNDIISVFESRGYVKSILGRKARLESRRFSYQGVSRVIQNSGGDHNKMCVLRACQYEDAHPGKIQVLMPIHDSIIWQRDPGHSPKEFVAALENVAQEFKLTVPIPFEVGSGLNWSVASYGEKIKDKTGWRI
jgi:DNA polymerase I-like protein with 3'-5' exonuclease and polymerase domains